MTIHNKWPPIRTKMDYKQGAPSRDTVPPTWFWMSSLASSQLYGRISAKPNQFSPSTSCSSRFSGGSITILQCHQTPHGGKKIQNSNFSCWIFPWSRFHPSFYLISFFIHIVYSHADLTHLYCQCPSPKRHLSLFTRSCCPLSFHFCLATVEIVFWQKEKHGKNCFLGFIHVLQTQ